MSANEQRREHTAVCDVDHPYRVCSISEVGPVREKNEDNMVDFDSPFGHVVIVADGMGGHGHGDLAAALVVNGFQESLLEQDASSVSVPEAIQVACSIVNNRIVEIGETMQQAVIGSTVVMVVLTRCEFYVAHVGDSRAYLMRNGSLTRLTKDHSVVQREIDDGFLTEEQARADSRSSMLTRALGTQNGNEIEIRGPLLLMDGDGILLSSDGLHGFAHDRQIEDAVLCNNLDPQKVTRGLVNLAIGTYFSNDNVTVQYIQIGKPKPNLATRPVFGRPRAAAEAATSSPPASDTSAGRPRPLWLRVLLWLNSAIVLAALGMGATHPSGVMRIARELRGTGVAGKTSSNATASADPHQGGAGTAPSRPAPGLRLGVVVNDRSAPVEALLKTIRKYGKELGGLDPPANVSFLLLLNRDADFPAGKANQLFIDEDPDPSLKVPSQLKVLRKPQLQRSQQVDALLVVNKAGEDPGVSPPAPSKLPGNGKAN